MKKTYIIPSVLIVQIDVKEVLMESSVPSMQIYEDEEEVESDAVLSRTNHDNVWDNE